MGEVYRARDERLERDVALKILPQGALGDEDSRRRFCKEALALSRFNHPNIATVYDFDRAGEVDFLVMELVEGETLRERIGRGPLTEKEVASLGEQIAEALAEAHEHGIIHRDLKPQNVVLTPKGRAKVLDFGLAKLLGRGDDADATASMTQTRSVAGTLPYMAPEQLRGEAMDARSDIFSLGAVLYEMATGRRPFPEEQTPRLIEAILHQEPVAPRAVNSRISPELERIILKCIEKDAEHRYHSAKEIAVDLRRLGAPSTARSQTVPAANPRRRRGLTLGVVTALVVATVAALHVAGVRIPRFSRTAPGSIHIQSLAVLPLQNLSHDPEQDYFADGMTDELTTELAQISGLQVISRTSAMQYKGTHKGLPEIARDLGVDAVIEGSVERSGDEVRISAQLINARTDTHLWARSYQRNLRDILAMQGEVARAIAGEIQIQLTPQEQARLERPRAVNPAAYEAYLKGRYHFEFHTGNELQKAMGEFQRAIQLDPSYALGYVGLSNAYHMLVFNGDASPQEVFPKAKDAVLKALQLDPQLAEAHACLALVLGQYDWDWVGAEREYKRAIELSPNNVSAHALYSEMLSIQGRHSEAIVEAERARELDPISPSALFLFSRAYFYGHQYNRAVQEFKNSLDINPNLWAMHLFLGQVYEQQGLHSQALAELRKGQGPTLLATSSIGYVFAVSGKEAEAKAILSDLIIHSKATYLPPTYIARIYVGLGEKDEAFAWLEKGYDARDSHMEFLAVDPMFDSLRSDPRLVDLLRRIGLPH